MTNFETLSAALQDAVAEMGFSAPTPIQAEALPVLLENRDLVGQSQTGTGKTAAFGIPLAERVDADNRVPQGLILCPTRELAVQVAEELVKLTKYRQGVSVTAIYGGDSYTRQLRDLKRGCQIVVGTPGRIIDHIDRGTLKLDQVSTVILDEADEMLDMGFRDDIKRILEETPEERQTVLFSATLSPEIMKITKRYQQDPHVIRIARTEVANQSIEQVYFEVKRELKTEALVRLLNYHQIELALVFCNTKRMADELTTELNTRGIDAEALHGDLRQAQRSNVMAKFKSGVTNVLIATDVAARGIDVQNVEAVFNFDIPNDAESYVHRIGRTGRAGRAGRSFAFVSSRDRGNWKSVLRFVKTDVPKGTIPTLAELNGLRQTQFTEKLRAKIAAFDTDAYDELIDQLAFDGYEARTVIGALLQMQLGELEATGPEIDFNAPTRGKRDRRDDRHDRFGGRGDRNDRFGDRGGRFRRDKPVTSQSSEEGMTRLFFNVGKRARIRPGDFVGAIAGEANISGRSIGAIDMYDTFTFVDVAAENAPKVIKAMTNSQIKGLRVNVDVAKP